MITKIVKRNGNVVSFDAQKIVNAIAKAGKATGEFDEKIARRLAGRVLAVLEDLNGDGTYVPHVEEVQDIVEEVLLRSQYKKTAKAYIIYRDQHAKMREIATQSSVDLVDSYLSKADWRVNENANVHFSLQGLNNYIAGEISKTYWLNKIYPPEIREAYKSGAIHIHDLGLISAYTYYGKEIVIVKDNKNDIFVISFEQLYDLINEQEQLIDKEKEVYVKYPQNYYVLDKNGWTKILRIFKKKKNKDMYFIKNRGGRSVIVTEDHPMITKGGEKQAKEVTNQDYLFTVNYQELLKNEPLFSVNQIDLLKELIDRKIFKVSIGKSERKGREKIYFNSVSIDKIENVSNEQGVVHTSTMSAPRFVNLTHNFGYAIGFTIAEGFLSYDDKASKTITLSSKNYDYITKVGKYFAENGFYGCIEQKNNSGIYVFRIRNCFLRFLFEEIFKIKPDSRHIALPVNILMYNKDFIKGIIAGLIDGDGSIDSSKTTINIRTASRTLMEMCSVAMSFLGLTPRDRNVEGQGSVRQYNSRTIKQNYPIYGLSFRKKQEVEILSDKYQQCLNSEKAWHDETTNEWHIVVNNEKTEIPDDYIYDITTESSTLIVNGMWNHNCVGWDLQDLLRVGFRGLKGRVESNPPKHFRVALMQAVNFLYTLQNETAGASAFSNFDTLLAPFIAYDNLTYKQVKQCIQEFLFNINVPTRTAGQVPFTNITLDITVPPHLKDQAVIIGGVPQDKTYGEFQEYMDMFNQALFECMMEGDASGRVFSFPIPTINITKEFDWHKPVVKLMLELTAKYGIFYFANFVNSDMKPEDTYSMCCRLRLDKSELRKKGGGLFGANALTGSIGVVTINLPRIGYLSTSEKDYFERLESLMNLAKNSLEIKRKVIERFTEAGLYPYAKFYLRTVKERTGKYWTNHFSTIGIIGMNESIANAKWLGEKGIWTQRGKEFALKVLDFMREKLIQYQEETGNFYNLEATPAEGTTYRFAKIDKQCFPDIITQGNDEPYYTNSTWLPVGFTESINYILDHQNELQSKYTGGTVQHIFLGEKPDPEKLGNFIMSVFSNYQLPYISITPTFSICEKHGYIEGEHFKCPTCGSETEVYSRIVGYLRPVNYWNKGKKEEFKDRKYIQLAWKDVDYVELERKIRELKLRCAVNF